MKKRNYSLMLFLMIFAIILPFGVKADEVSTADELNNCLASDGKTCVLKNDITADEFIVDAKKIVLDLNGKNLYSWVTVTNKGNLTINDSGSNGSITKGDAVLVDSGSTFILNGGIINSESSGNGVYVEGATFVMNNGTVKAKEFGIAYIKKSSITINGGTIKTLDNCAMGDNGTSGYGGNTVILNGGSLISNISTSGYISCGIYNANSTNLTVNSGVKITANNGGAGIVVRGGKVTVASDVIDNMVTGDSLGYVGDSKTKVSGKIVKDYRSNYPDSGNIDIQISYNTNSDVEGSKNIVNKQEEALNSEVVSIINSNKFSELSNVDLTDISIKTVVSDVNDNSRNSTVEKAKDIIGDYIFGKAVDLEVILSNKDEVISNISETVNKIPFSISVDDIVTNDKLNYEFQILRYHVNEDGEEVIDILDSLYDDENNTITFESDKFSTFLINYKTTEKNDDLVNTNNASNPNTFDGSMISMIITFVSLISLFGTIKVLENRK